MWICLTGVIRVQFALVAMKVSHCVVIDQIEYSRAMMYNTMDKAAYVWTEVNKSEEEVAKSLTDEDAGSHGHADSVL